MQQIAKWLDDIGLPEYSQCFAENGIDVSVLRDLTDQDLKEMGVLLGHRRKILAAIDRVTGLTPSSTPVARRKLNLREAAERRQVTVLFSDLVGSTALSAQLDPEDLRDVIALYQNCVAQILRRSRGFVARYMGDGVLAYFGYPEAREDDAERAVRTGLELVAAVSALKTLAPLRARVGIATGMVVVGDLLETSDSRERDIVGETPNLAARLQSMAEPGTVVISDSTRKQLGKLFELEDLGARELKGIPKPVQSWAVLRAMRAGSRFEALHAGATTLIGREEELEFLNRCWRSAKNGQARVVLLSGDAGMGKSHLVATFIDRLEDDAQAVLQYFCAPHGQDSALYAVISGLEREAGFEQGDTIEAKFNKVKALITANSDVAEDVLLVAELLSLAPTGVDDSTKYSPQRRKEKTLYALVRYLTGMASRRPVLLIFEDGHWIDPTSRDFLDLAIQRIRQLPLMAIVTVRPDFQSSWTSQPHVRHLILPRLAPEESVALVRLIERADAPLPDNVVEKIIARSDGVPLFLEEVTRAVFEAADASNFDGAAGTQAQAMLDRIIPSTLHASLIGRLDHLGTAAKEVAQSGAAIGREFSYELLAAATEKSPSYLQDALTRLVEKGLIFQSGALPLATFLFKHALVQDAAYSTLLRGARRELHARIANALLAMNADDGVAPEMIALHLQNAELAAEAIVYWRKAGEQCVRRANNREAAAHFRRALSLLAARSPTNERWRAELAILSQLGPALMGTLGWNAAEVGEVVERATTVRRLVESSEEIAPSIANLWIYHWVNGRLDAAEEVSHDLLKIGHDLDSPEVLLQAHHTAWPLRWGRGALKDAMEHIDAGLALYDEDRHAHHRFLYLGHDPAVCGLAIASQLCSACGHAERARDSADRALSLARRLDHEPTLVHGLWFVVESQITRGDVAGVMANTAELLELAERYGLPQPRAMGQVYRGWALASLGNIPEGIALAEEGARTLEQSGYSIFLSRVHGFIAEIHLMGGRYAEGLSKVEQALRIASDLGESFYVARLLQMRAMLSQSMGQADEAIEADFRRSLEVAIRQGAKAFELRASTGLASLWTRRGKRDQARNLLQPICGWFTEGLDTPDFKHAIELLHTLE